MKHIFYIFIVFILLTNLSFSQDIWINEFSYNSLGDGDEFIELVGPVGTDMSRFGLALFYSEGQSADEYYTHYFANLSGSISSTNSNNGKGFFVIKTNNSHLLETITPIPSGVTKQTITTDMYNLQCSGFLLFNLLDSKIIHCVIYESPIDAPTPGQISNKNLVDSPEGIEYFDISTSTTDIIREPLVDGGNSNPNGSISMIGTGFSHLWTTTNGLVRNSCTPGNINYNQSALPVELSIFSASILKIGVKLNWRTETEVNNYGFDVERKSETSNWERISFVNGNGNSNSPKEYSYIDQTANTGKYLYRLKQIDNDGAYSYSKVVEVEFNRVTEYSLSQNYPNPFNPITTISFTLPLSGNVKLTIFNLLGQEIKTLTNGFKEAGIYTFNFDAKNLNSGIYLYKIEANGFTQTRKMTLVK